MAGILEQLGLDQTFFSELIIFAVLFFVLTRVYFKPFMRLFDVRHQRTIEDQEAAQKLLAQAESRFDEYKRKLAEERASAKKEYDAVLEQARKEEAALLTRARDEAKKITQDAAESVNQQHEQLRKQLQADVESLAQTISEKLLSRKV